MLNHTHSRTILIFCITHLLCIFLLCVLCLCLHGQLLVTLAFLSYGTLLVLVRLFFIVFM